MRKPPLHRDELIENLRPRPAIEVAPEGLGQHYFPPAVPTREFRMDENERPGDPGRALEGYLPDHLDLRLMPRQLPAELRVPVRVPTALDVPKDGVHQATTVFAPDDRYVFNDTSYPWCTVGRVDTPGGQASGAMVGPRHMLTCSHTIQWNADGTAGWVKFTPSYFDGSEPFGVAWGTMIYWEGIQVVGPTIDAEEGKHDYVCVVLDSRMGEQTGWMGSRVYDNDWDGQAYWRHIGYPGDLASGARPCYQEAIALDGIGDESHQRTNHFGDVWPGQSGGPFFAWWDGESWPTVVCDQSGETSSVNSASGGTHMVECILRALGEFP